MGVRETLRDIDWQTIVIALATAAITAWGLGFLAGLFVRLVL